jgi:hypothetical protein
MREKYCLQVINAGKIPGGYGVSLLPREGLEPTLPCRKRILSPPRLPFRHLGTLFIVNCAEVEVKISIPVSPEGAFYMPPLFDSL